MAAIASHHTFSDFRQHRCVLLQWWRLEKQALLQPWAGRRKGSLPPSVGLRHQRQEGRPRNLAAKAAATPAPFHLTFPRSCSVFLLSNSCPKSLGPDETFSVLNNTAVNISTTVFRIHFSVRFSYPRGLSCLADPASLPGDSHQRLRSQDTFVGEVHIYNFTRSSKS